MMYIIFPARFQLLRIFPGNVDTDGDGVIDEQEMRIKYLNRELFIETVMNDGDRVSGALVWRQSPASMTMSVVF